MPLKLTVSDVNLSSYPQLKSFIESEPADLGLLGLFGPDYKEKYQFCIGRKCYSASLIQVCSIFGKTEHLKSLLGDKKREGVINAIIFFFNWIKSFFVRSLSPKMVAEDRAWSAIRIAAEFGHTDTIKYLESHLSNAAKRSVIRYDNEGAISLAAEGGHIDTIKYLESHLTAQERTEAICSRDYSAVKNAILGSHTELVYHFLNDSAVLAYIEAHDREYGQRYVYDFVTQKLDEFKNRKLAYEHAYPDSVFNLEEEEARLCFYMLRNFIRRGVNRDYAPAEMNEDHIRFLLSIPAVKAQAHHAFHVDPANEVQIFFALRYPPPPNALLRLAYDLGNETAARLLLDIPAVRELASQNNFYRNERAGRLDLRALAQDLESSMRALSQGEQKRLAQATQRYQPLLQATGVAHIMDDLRNRLTQYYQEAPAQLIKDDSSTVNLPVSWEEFQALELSEREKDSAQHAYYQNPNHSALRYLSKPNRWMHERASYVQVDEHNLQYRWSTFEEYQPLIAMLWLAAQDEELAPTEDHTIEGRIKNFIRELSLIGRAHNWDKTREKNGKSQEYDDLEADRPSCFSGVKRRLFQSVIGHPLLKILTCDDLKQEVRDFALSYFKREIARLNNKEAMKETFNNYLVMLDEESASPLACIAITAQEQERFVQYLTDKYGEAFTSNPDFVRLVQSLITVNPESQAVSDHYHALKLDGLTQLSFYLRQENANAPASQAGFFAGQQPEAANQPIDNEFVCS